MEARIKFLRYMNSKRLIYRFEWDIVAVPLISGGIIFVALIFIQLPSWASPLFSFIGAWKILNIYKALIKNASPGYLYHFFYSIGLWNPTVIEKKSGKNIRVNPRNIPFGFENEFRD